MESVAQYDLGIELLEFSRADRFNRAVGTDRHENRRVDHAVLECHPPAAGATVGRQQFKFHSCF